MINKVVLIGRLGADPDIRFMPAGGGVCNVTLATSLRRKDKDTGEKKEYTEWHRVVFFNRLAEIVGQYLKKGSLIYIEGRLRTRKWQYKDGSDRYTTEIIAENMQMLDSKGESAAVSSSAAPLPASSNQPTAAPSSLDDFDDVPF